MARSHDSILKNDVLGIPYGYMDIEYGVQEFYFLTSLDDETFKNNFELMKQFENPFYFINKHLKVKFLYPKHI